MDIKSKIKEHIAKGETEKAIELLVTHTKDKDSEFHDEAVLLSGQFRQWKREVTLGVQQSSGELRRIEVSIMNLLQDRDFSAKPGAESKKSQPSAKPIVKPITSPSTIASSADSGNSKMIIGAAIGVLAIGLLFWLFSGGDSLDDHSHPVDNITEEVPLSNADPIDQAIDSDIPAPAEPIEVDDTIIEESEANAGTVSTIIYIDGNGTPIGTFEQVDGTNTWQEIRLPSDEVAFEFEETGRDEWSVYLFDASDQKRIQLDLYTQKVRYGYNDEELKDLYNISEAY